MRDMICPAPLNSPSCRLFRVEGQRPGLIKLARHGRQLAAALFEKNLFNLIVPVNGVQDTDRPLGLDQPIAQGANHALIGRQRPLRRAIDQDRGFAHRT
jgi:hypothetical protein